MVFAIHAEDFSSCNDTFQENYFHIRQIVVISSVFVCNLNNGPFQENYLHIRQNCCYFICFVSNLNNGLWFIAIKEIVDTILLFKA
jgi:hypothetical protein